MSPIRSIPVLLLGAALAFAPRSAAGQTVTTLAGSGAAGKADGPGATASFERPGWLAVDAVGNVYVTQHQALRKITSQGSVTTLAVPLEWPSGVAADGAGNVFVVDQSAFHPAADRILRVSLDGRVTKIADSPVTWGLAGITVDASGNLIAADPGDSFEETGGGHVLKVTREGSVSALTGPGTPIPLDDPLAVALDAAGNFYVTTWRGAVLRLEASGMITTLASGLVSPAGIAVDRAGGIFVTEGGKNRILKIQAGGGVSVVAGTGAAGSADGPGSTATFNGPTGIGLDGVGNLYVADNGNNTVRRIALGAACGSGCAAWTVPSVARTAGPNGSFWTSSLTLHNRGASPAAVTLKFLGHDADGSAGPERNATVPPSGTITLGDVLASAFGLSDGYGAIQVRTASDVVVRSRTSTISAGGTIGDGIPGVRFDRLVTDQTSPRAVLIGLREDEGFRTNLVLVNGSASPVDVLVTALDASGTPLGSKTRTLRPYEMTQDAHVLAGPEFGAGAKTDVTIAVSTATPGGAFTACAIVIDNGSNAPTTVLPQ